MPPTKILAFFCFLAAAILEIAGRPSWAKGAAYGGVAFLVSPW